MGNGNPIWPGGRQRHDFESVDEFLEDMLSVKEWHPDCLAWFKKTLAEIERLRAIVECCSDVVPPDESLEVNERVVVELERLQTWNGLMTTLDKYYPSDVFDGSSDDSGPRIVVLCREVERLRAVAAGGTK